MNLPKLVVAKSGTFFLVDTPADATPLTNEQAAEVIRRCEDEPKKQARIAELEAVAKELLDEAERRSSGFPSKWTKAEEWFAFRDHARALLQTAKVPQ